jgi:hypothetical protein
MIQTCNSSLKSPFGEWLINTTTTSIKKIERFKVEKKSI